VKGINYTLASFLGKDSPLVEAAHNKQLYHISLYLSPGDYHGIHSPINWTINKRRHIPGRLLPVAPVVVKQVQGVFASNERVVLEGKWEHGLFALTPVGASNVGSIKLTFDPELITNKREAKKELFHDKSFGPNGLEVKAGDEVAFFHMGSTVVLVFECPEKYAFQFDIQPGEKVKVGQPIGRLVKKNGAA
jgi:phosphatidylserine decarboxylase